MRPESTSLSPEARLLVSNLRKIVGRRHVLTKKRQMDWYQTGFRFGAGSAVAVVRPDTLLELWQVLQACVTAGAVIIVQAANTGLTGGSTPDGEYDNRPPVIISTLRIKGIQVISSGRQVICLPGATLHELEQTLRPFGREPHSVIGSSCIGASVVGGICNNSGGALIRRGPAYTEMALFAQIDKRGQLSLTNHLGVALGSSPEEILANLQNGNYSQQDVSNGDSRIASDRDYCREVRKIDSSSPARFNADPRLLTEASGCAGKMAVLAVRLDTFRADEATSTFYIGTNSPDELAEIRREVLRNFPDLPVAGEYIHRDAFVLAERFGKDIALSLRLFGSSKLPWLFRLKSRIDATAKSIVRSDIYLSDHILQYVAAAIPFYLPKRIRATRDRFQHHLILKMSDDGINVARSYLSSIFPSYTGDFFECTESEAELAFLHRFSVAAAANKYRAMHQSTVEDIVSFDIALPRSERNWFESLPPEINRSIVHRIYYGHFFCHVFHHDYVLKKGADADGFKREMSEIFDRRGAEYPAEHNVGHLYTAKPALEQFYRKLDPQNRFNPGIGKTSRMAGWE